VTTNSQATQSAAMQFLNTVTQALPTNGAGPLVTAGAVGVPMTPASMLQVLSPQPLAVMNANQYQVPVPPLRRPLYRNPFVLGPAALIGLGLIGFLIWKRR